MMSCDVISHHGAGAKTTVGSSCGIGCHGDREPLQLAESQAMPCGANECRSGARDLSLLGEER